MTDFIALAPGARWYPGAFDPPAQAALLAQVRAVLVAAPLFTPTMPRTGQPLSVRMSNCGPLGWVSDAAGYRYQPFHPQTREPWPPLPDELQEAYARFGATERTAEACLINYYGPDARMSLHQDRDEADLTAPVVSISLGDTALFRLGTDARGGSTRSIRLASGDVFVLAGVSRLAFHGVDRILGGSSRLLPEGGASISRCAG